MFSSSFNFHDIIIEFYCAILYSLKKVLQNHLLNPLALSLLVSSMAAVNSLKIDKLAAFCRYHCSKSTNAGKAGAPQATIN